MTDQPDQPDELSPEVLADIEDALAAVDGEKVQIGLGDSNSSCLIRADGAATARYVVMPMRL